MQFDFRRKFTAVVALSLAACLTLFAVDDAAADAKEQLTGHGGVALPLQQVIRNERPRGPVFVAIPIAYVFGLGGDRSPTYCSPTIRAENTSNKPVEELIVGIEYQTKDGRPAGGTITSYGKIKVGQQNTHYFYQLTVSDCRGLEGKLTVVRCMYTSGEDCRQDVQAIGFGTIPLHLSTR